MNDQGKALSMQKDNKTHLKLPLNEQKIRYCNKGR